VSGICHYVAVQRIPEVWKNGVGFQGIAKTLQSTGWSPGRSQAGASSHRTNKGRMRQVFELGGDVVAPALAHGLMRLVAEGAGEGDEAADAELRAQAANAYLRLLAKPKLPDILLKVRLPAPAAGPCRASRQGVLQACCAELLPRK